MKTFENKTVLITGASSGIGEAFAQNLAKRRSNLILTARSENKLRYLAEELIKTHSIDCHVFPTDLSETPNAKWLFDQISENGLSVDVLINNAGFGKWGKFLNYDRENYQNMIDLNVNSLIQITHLFLPSMIEKRDGGVINVASTAAFQPIPYGAVYVGSKAFVLSFSESLWGEYRKSGVTITALCPGTTATNFFNVAIPDGTERENRMKKLPQIETPEKVAQIGLEAFLKGKNYVISGGKNYFLANLSRIFPRSFVIKIAKTFFEPEK